MKKAILHILNSRARSGAENVVIKIIQSMRVDIEFKFIYASLDGPIRRSLEENSISFEPIRKMNIREIRRLVKKTKPDIIHAHDFTASMVCALSMTNVPIICHLHNNSPWIKKYGWKSISFLLTCFRYRKILLVSISILNEYIFSRQIESKTSIIGNPIDISEILGKAQLFSEYQTHYDLVFIGRLSEAKNPIRFLNIVKDIKANFPSLQVAILGDGELRELCLSTIIEMKLEKNINMLGFIENPYPILCNSKILCMTSSWEGFGLVAVEALTLGIPVVATPVGGLVDIIDSTCGMLTDDNRVYILEILHLLNTYSYWSMKSKNAIERSRILDNPVIYFNNLNKIYMNCFITNNDGIVI